MKSISSEVFRSAPLKSSSTSRFSAINHLSFLKIKFKLLADPYNEDDDEEGISEQMGKHNTFIRSLVVHTGSTGNKNTK